MEEKSQADIEIEALADIFGIATTGFEEFYKKSKAASSTTARRLHRVTPALVRRLVIGLLLRAIWVIF